MMVLEATQSLQSLIVQGFKAHNHFIDVKMMFWREKITK
jgi:hypothetical protein